jgi:hypothetical protein
MHKLYACCKGRINVQDAGQFFMFRTGDIILAIMI